MNLDSEHDLLNAAKTFEPSALTAIYKLYSPGIYRYAVRLLGDECLAEDCVAETFSRYLKALRAGKGPDDHLQAYLYRIAHNWITDSYRRQPFPQVELEDSFPENDHDPPEAQVSNENDQRQVRSALRSLTSDQRLAITLRYLEGWDNEEIMSVMNKSAGTIRALQFRGIRTLRKLLISGEKEGIHEY
jgi:RNA polymerase sigma-70 factor (ECF subfamily)